MATDSKIALITGAGSGIGKATSIGLLKAGFTVVLTGRHRDRLESTIEAAGEAGKNAVAIPADVTQPASVQTLFTEIKKEFGRLDLLFNNAGTNVPGVPLEELTFEQWNAIINTNLSGVFLCIQEAFKLMKTQDPMGGRIINNGSISAQVPRPHSSPYTASKFGVTGLTRCAALDGRKYNIACGQIDIGNVTSHMTERMSGGVPQADGSLRPEPTIQMQHVVDAVLYMAALPLDANVLSLTVMASQMPFVGRG